MDLSAAKRRKVDLRDPYRDASNVAAALDAAADTDTSRPSTFVAQAEELLKEVRIDYNKTFAGADDVLGRIKAAIEAIKPQNPTPIHEASEAYSEKHNIQVPFPDPKPPIASRLMVSFSSPTKYNVVGSFVSRTMIKSQNSSSIDMVVEMPRNIFQEKDYLDLRYFYKRAYYLAHLATPLGDELGPSASFTFSYCNGNRLLPVLNVAPSSFSKGHHIRIIPCAPPGLFPSRKLLPTSCCLKFASELEKGTGAPTTFYNSTLIAESCYLFHLKLLHQAEKACPAFRDACILGRVWLLQRGFDGAVSGGGFGHFEWAFLTALLLQNGGRKGFRPLSVLLSSTQIFKAVVQYLAGVDLCKAPPVLDPSGEGAIALEEDGPVLLDVSNQLNVAYKMSSSSAFMLQQYSRWTQKSLADQEANHFHPTFIIKADLPFQVFDVVVRLERLEGTDEAIPSMVDYRGAHWKLGCKTFSFLKRALGNRVQLICAQDANNLDVGNRDVGTWNLHLAAPSGSSAILVGMLFDSVNMTRQVDHGPQVEEKAAAKEFRQFWGDKAELRHFKNGSIRESLLWTQRSPLGLCEEITRHVLKLHLKLQNERVQFYGQGFSSLIPVKPSDTVSFQAAQQALGVLERDLRELRTPPLRIKHVAATAPELRFSSVRPPSFAATGRFAAQPMEAVIYLEASGKWPDNLAAIQRTKIAFFLRYRELMAKSKPGLSCRVGLEEADAEIDRMAFLDVTDENDLVFRLRMHSDMEESVLERRTKDRHVDQQIRAQGRHSLATFKRSYKRLPPHTQMISTLCMRFPALSPTIRLVKHWFNMHKLSCHFLEEMIELLALRVFLEPYPWQVPSSGMTGFLRTLQFLSRWDWRAHPLILDAFGNMSKSERSSIETRLEAWRKVDPGMKHTTLIIATSHDVSGTACTFHDGHPRPCKVVATRMTTLARSACKLVKEQGLYLEAQSLFQPSLNDYDVLIHLDPKFAKKDDCYDEGAKAKQFKNLPCQSAGGMLPMFREASKVLLEQLNAVFSDALLFFHGAQDDMVIAGIWNPETVRSGTFKIPLFYSSKPRVDSQEHPNSCRSEDIEANRDAIIAEVARIGGDYISRIECSKQSCS